jgi:hypothetical protein
MPHSHSSNRVAALYRDRNSVLAMAAKMAQLAGYEVWLGLVNDPTEFSQYAIYFQLPHGQVSWHLATGDLSLFAGIPIHNGRWDTSHAADKILRIAEFITGRDVVMPQPPEEVEP